MEIIRTVSEMQRFAESARRAGRRIALVPTMGYFHEGHLSLMREGKKRGDLLVVSLYVNPTQFAPTEDFSSYPRDFERDRGLAAGEGTDILFVPDDREMYPEGYQTYVLVEGITDNLCGKSRPIFFRGVTTVCTKLFHIVKPHLTVFGRKDFQQFVTIMRMVRDLNLDMEVVGLPTVREPDGLAMSSRNVRLSPSERIASLSLSCSLLMAERLYERGERNAGIIIQRVSDQIAGQPGTEIDYVQICDAATMRDIPLIDGEAVLALAVRVGKTRLIDNHLFGEPLAL